MLQTILHSHYQQIKVLPDQPQETRQFRCGRRRLSVSEKDNVQQSSRKVEPFRIKAFQSNFVFAGKRTKTPEEPEKESPEQRKSLQSLSETQHESCSTCWPLCHFANPIFSKKSVLGYLVKEKDQRIHAGSCRHVTSNN